MTQEEMSKRDELEQIIVKTNYNTLSIVIRKAIGLKEALFFGYLLSLEKSFDNHGVLNEDRYFYRTAEQITIDTGITSSVRQDVQKRLVDSGLISIELRKTPETEFQKTNFYRINYDVAIAFIAEHALIDSRQVKRTQPVKSKGLDGEVKSTRPVKSKTTASYTIPIKPEIKPDGIILDGTSVLVPENIDASASPSAKNADGFALFVDINNSESKDVYDSAKHFDALFGVGSGVSAPAHDLIPASVVHRFDWNSVHLDDPRSSQKRERLSA